MQFYEFLTQFESGKMIDSNICFYFLEMAEQIESYFLKGHLSLCL